MTVELNVPAVTGFAELLEWANTIVGGVFGYLTVIAVFIITYTTVTAYTRDERGAFLAGAFMSFVTSSLWIYVLNTVSLLPLTVVSLLLLASAFFSR